jgi:selenocysteine lyase/cysteine desulfurase
MEAILEVAPVSHTGAKSDTAFAELERSVHAALETYSNVHRGSGHNSVATTHLYEQAGDIVLEYLGLARDEYLVVFCTPRKAELLKAQLAPNSYRTVSSQDLGLPLGVRALAIARKSLPAGASVEPGGGTARLVAPGWIIWAKAPDKFEAGTPAIVNVIAFAKALQLARQYGAGVFEEENAGASVNSGMPAAAAVLESNDLEPNSGRVLLHALRQTFIGRGVLVPTMKGDRPYINLDNGASTPTFALIWEAARRAWRAPASAGPEIAEEVRSVCADVLHAPLQKYDIVFTGNTTESINLVAESIRRDDGSGTEPVTDTVVVNTLLEHNSNELPWRVAPGVKLVRLDVDGEGFVDLRQLEALLHAYNEQGAYGRQRIKLVTVSGASNVLGTCNDLAEISRVVHRYGARLLVDAAQLVAHRAVDMEAWEIDYLAFSGHKVYAPFGTGLLVAKKGLLQFSPDELQGIQASGEENTGGIAALGKALLLLGRIGLEVIQEEEQALTAQALRGMAQIPGVEVYGIKDPGSPSFANKGGVISFTVKDTMAGPVAEALAARGIGIRSGCHCAHLLVKHVLHIHPVLEQFQGLILTLLPKLSLPGVDRVSLGIENTAEDVDALLAALAEIAQQPKAQPKFQAQLDAFAQGVAQRVYG